MNASFIHMTFYERAGMDEMEDGMKDVEQTASTQHKSLHGLNRSLLRKAQSYENEVSKLNAENKELSEMICGLRSRIRSANTELTILRAKLERVKEIDSRYMDLKGMVAQKEALLRNLESTLGKFQKEQDDLNREVICLKGKASILERKVRSIKKDSNRVRDELTTKLDQLEHNLANINSEKEFLQKHISSLEN